MKGPANGAARTLLGYYLGRLLCRLGAHSVAEHCEWEDNPVAGQPQLLRVPRWRWCIRPTCDWGEE